MIVITLIAGATSPDREEVLNKKNLNQGLLTGFVTLLIGAHNTSAQDITTKGGGLILEEVIVTAEKRSESMQDIPIAISAFTGDMLENSGALSVKDLQKISPSLQFGQDGAVNYIGMRGVSAGLGVIGADGAVTISQNGVTLGRLSLWDSDLYDIDRIEILRGPQGVINGRNATGGAINIYSNLPTEVFEAGVKATMGNYNRFATQGYISGTLMNSGIRGRLAFSKDNSDGWLDNTLLNEKLNGKNKSQFRATFATDVSDELEAILILDSIRDKSTRNGGFDRGRIRADQPGLAEFLNIPSGDIDDLNFESDQTYAFDKEQYGATVKLIYALSPSATLTSTTGFVDQDLHQTYDCDGTRRSYCGFPSTQAFTPGYDFEVTQISQELTLAADLSEDLDLILGGLYLKDDSKHFNHFTAADAGIVADLVQVQASADLESYAVYTQLRYQLTETLRVAAGVRYTKDKKEYGEQGIVFFPGSYTASRSWDATTPRLAIDYQPNDDLMFFASASRGFRSGGYSITFLGPVDEFDPEFVWSYEAGLKATLFEGSTRLAVSGFYMDYKNIQQVVFGLNGTGTQTINASGADIQGIELEIDAVITDNFRIDFSGTWLDTEFTDFHTADPIFPELGEFNPVTGLNVRDLSGNRVSRSPEWKFNIGGEYRTNLGSGLTGTFRADYTWQSEIFFGPYNYDLAEQESYGLLGARASLEDEGGNWSVDIWARNILDERYFQSNSVFGVGLSHPTPAQVGLLGAPRTYGVTFSYDF